VKLLLRILGCILLALGYTAAFFRFKQGTYAIDEAIVLTVALFIITVAFLADWSLESRNRKRLSAPIKPQERAV
jgi:hypothetical protein